MAQTRADKAGRSVVRGFTLIELLVVVIIIGILIAIVMSLGGGLITSGQARATRDTIRIMDMATAQMITELGETPVIVEAPDPDSPSDLKSYPMLDGVDLTVAAERSFINTAGLFVHKAENEGLGDLFASIDEQLLVRFDGDDPIDPDVTAPEPGRQPELRTVVDAWGQPLRVVHPVLDGLITTETLRLDFEGELTSTGESLGAISIAPIITEVLDLSIDPMSETTFTSLRRSYIEKTLEDAPTEVGDSDGGLCTNNQPYVYSAGEDGDPSTLDNNVYTVEPTRPAINWEQ